MLSPKSMTTYEVQTKTEFSSIESNESVQLEKETGTALTRVLQYEILYIQGSEYTQYMIHVECRTNTPTAIFLYPLRSPAFS